MRFVCLGVGDAFSARWYSSSLAVEHDGAWLLVDCPHPIRKMLREAGEAAATPLDVDRFLGVALTHLHADHASGLEDFAYYSVFTLHRPVALLAHPEVLAELWDPHFTATMARPSRGPGGERIAPSREDFFAFHPLREQESCTLGPFAIECRRTIHPIPTFALRIGAGGRTLGLSSDTSYDPGLIDWLAPADLIVHETNYGIHTPYGALAALPAELRRKLRLIHYPDDFDSGSSIIEPLEQGRSYTV